MTRGIVRTTLAVTLFAGLLAGCATPPGRSYVVLLESPDGTVGKILVQGAKGNQLITQACYSSLLNGSQASSAPVNEAQFNRDFGEAIAARPALPQHFLLYFETGGTQLTAESQALLPHILELAAQSPILDMSIIGHTDTMGAANFNADISLQRAQLVADLMKSQGLKIHSLTVESHGERHLLVPTPDETPEPRNRRVEITLR
jgi:peptidoglycan-associated lipoprotein